MAKPLLADVAYQKIKEQILQESRDFISENYLVEFLDMSRTPIRGALQQLSHEGLITIVPNKGIFIKELTYKEVHDLYETRLAIETYNLKRLPDFITESHISKLEQTVFEQQKAIESEDHLLIIKLDVQFHRQLLEVVDNHNNIQIFTNLSDRLYRMNKQTLRDPYMGNRFKEHKQIIEFIKVKNYKLAIEEMEKHLNSWRTGAGYNGGISL